MRRSQLKTKGAMDHREAVIVEALRTPVDKRNGALAPSRRSLSACTGLQSMGEGGGMANVTIIELVEA